VVTVALIVLNVATFTALIAAARSQGGTLEEGSEGVLERFAWAPGRRGEWWRWVSYAFLHSPSDWFHIAGNMLFLWVFGPSVEGRLGHVGFSVLYVLGAAAAAFAHSLNSEAGLIGASGAVAAVSGAFIIFYPRVPFRLLLVLGMVVYTIPAYWFIMFVLARDFFGLGMGGQVSHAAHLGGYGVGMAGMVLLLATGVLKREPQYDLVSIFKHKQRLREFKAASEIHAERERRVKTGEKRGREGAEVLNPDSEAIAVARASVSTELSRHDVLGATRAYKEMLGKFPNGGTAIILSRQNQLAIGNGLFQNGDAATALPAYRHFLVMYPKDAQAAHVRLMIGLIRTRYVVDADEAKREIQAALPGLVEAEDVELARQLLEELGGTGEG
jgi:membrane associated rhomboid family serine protease